MDLPNSAMLMSICSWDVVLQGMLLLRLSILKTWRPNTTQFVICSVWDLFSIFCWWAEVPFQEKTMMKFSHKIEPVISISKGINIRSYQQIQLNYLKRCWKRTRKIECIRNRHCSILTSIKWMKRRIKLILLLMTILNAILHYLLPKIKKGNNSIRKIVVLISNWANKILWMVKHNPLVVLYTPNLVELTLKALNLHQWSANLLRKNEDFK